MASNIASVCFWVKCPSVMAFDGQATEQVPQPLHSTSLMLITPRQGWRLSAP
jgi:hypothetical protein